MSLRPTTNLVVPAHLKLDKAQLKDGFMYVYGKAYSGPEPVFITRLWLSSFMPELATDPTFGKNRKGMREWAKFQGKHLRAGYLKIKKVNDPNDPHFIVSVPLAEFNREASQETFERYRQWFTTGKEMPENESAKALHDELVNSPREGLEQKVVPAAQVINNMHWLDARGKAALQKTLIALRLTYVGGLALVVADFRISKEEAQQLSCNEWLTIRNIDLYPLLLQWVAGQYGYTEHAPLAAFPISKVAQTLPAVPSENIRVNAEGLSIDPKGIPMWLPHKLDQTAKYESLYSQVGDIGDDSFSLLSLQSVAEQIAAGVDEIKIKLPANIPVLIDWVNNKYAYTQSTGMLKIQDLSRFKKADVGHIFNLLEVGFLTTPLLTPMMALAKYAGADMHLRYTPGELEEIGVDDDITAQNLSNNLDISKAWPIITEYYETYIGGLIHYKFVSAEGDAIMRALGRWIEAARLTVLGNLEAVNAHFAVATVTAVLGRMTLMSYANKHGEIVTHNNTENAAALNQGVEEGWVPPSIPLASDRLGFLPHQEKVRNLLKDSPAFAILPVQAGGGKSVLSITDVLYEIKANRSQPYLILCPNHLVAQYVKEFVFFTEGQMNVVPVNNYVMRRNGFERMTKMLENAPRNTIVVADYDTLRARQQQICYGTTSVTVYPVIEFLRQFNFGYAMLDESHYVKNDSQRTRACMVLISDIPKKRLASGTMAHDSPSDLAIQIGMLDPTLFGSRDAFNDRYGAEVKGDRVIEWNPGAQQEIMAKIKTRVVVAKAMRKEWAALLPHAEEKFHGVSLSPGQQDVYTAILTEALEHIKKDAKSNSALAKFFKPIGAQVDEEVAEGDEQNPAEAAADEDEGADLEALLGFYLARLEQFISAPASDPLGNQLLKGNDRISPKMKKIIECCETHINNKYPGKVLIFTNYTASAEAIFENLPPHLKSKALLYVAAEKVETGHLFENDPNKMIMIGVENSMNTGLNLQFVARLIRVETVWNPGTLEQGNSRVNRPELKKVENRGSIYYDWIVANRTVDITKISRLISKVIAVAKFENAEDVQYTSIPDVSVIPMNEESIMFMNDWEQNLVEYAQAYKKYKDVQTKDYADYRAKHGDLKLKPVSHAPMPKDAKLMAEVPYVPGLELYGTDALGLVRADEFLRQELTLGEGEEGPDTDDEEAGNAAEMQRRKDLNTAIAGQVVHTEFGDGVVKSIRHKTKSLNVLLNSGYSVLVNMAAAFVVTKPDISGGVLRQQLLTSVGKGVQMPVMAPTGLPGSRFRIDSVALRRQAKEKLALEKEKEATERNQEMNIEIEINISNGFLGLTYFVDEDRPDVNNALQALGFQPNPPFVLAEVKTHMQLRKQFDIWDEAGFTFDKFSVKNSVHEAFADMWKMLKNGAVIQHREMYTFGTRNKLVNFFRQESKPSISKTEFKPYPMIEDGKTFIVMHTRGQPATLLAMKKRAPGIRWQHGADSMLYYGLDAAHTVAKLKQILDAGIQISNINDLSIHVKKLRRVKVRNSESDSTALI